MKLFVILMSILYVANSLLVERDTESKPRGSVNTTQEVSLSEIEKKDWDAWKMTYGKSYINAEDEKFRMEIYKENRLKVEKHNKAALDGLHSYTLGMNQFSDMKSHEFKTRMNRYMSRNVNVTDRHLRSTYLPSANLLGLPATVDWRTKGHVTPIKNQKQCGSCWAFSTTGSLEGQHFRKSGNLVSLSEQQLVDCSGKFGNFGCNGGLMDNAFKYIKANGGIDTEASYPYEARDGKCRYNPATIGATIAGFTDIPEGDETALQNAVATIGPISAAIDASHFSFQLYHQGVYYERRCSSTRLDHGILVVGYGTEDGQDYWLIKNSWGTTWGEKGYIKMARNRKNNCGIATQASYPLV